MSAAMRGWFIVASLFVGSCASAPRERTYIGTYVDSFETMAFQECGSSERWWVRTEPDARRTMMAAAPPRVSPNDSFVLGMEVVGELSPRGGYGHLSQYPRELHIKRVIRASADPPSCN